MALQHTTPPTRRGDRDAARGDAPSPERVLELLDDDCNRTILEATRTEAKSARALTDACEVSRVTVYRRLDDLEDAGLVETAMEYDADGHHRTVYRARLDSVTVDVTDGSLALDVSTGDSARNPASARRVDRPRPADTT